MWAKMSNFALVCLSAVLLLVTEVAAIYPEWCYKCHSNQQGCGSPLDTWLQRWEPCGKMTACVKIIEKYNGQEYVTRGCLNELQKITIYREDMPMVQRHGYCLPGRGKTGIQVGGVVTTDEPRIYCFCDDWSGCNHAGHLQVKILTLITPCLLAVYRFFF